MRKNEKCPADAATSDRGSKPIRNQYNTPSPKLQPVKRTACRFGRPLYTEKERIYLGYMQSRSWIAERRENE